MYEVYEEESEKMQEYLTRLGYSEETIKSYINSLNYFFNWILKEKMDMINQKSLMLYNEYLHKQSIKRTTIQAKLVVLKLYDQFLQRVENRKIITKPLRSLGNRYRIKTRNLNPKRNQKTISRN